MPGTLDDYEVIDTIGAGTYGTCKKVRRKKDGKIFVWKEMPYGHMSEKEKMMIVSEVNLLRELKHEHIVRYYERYVDKASSTIFIIMEYCEGGDLSSVIKNTKKESRYIDEAYIWKVCHQTILAMSALQEPTKNRKSVLHRDLKPANIFLDSSLNVKVGDFGLARVLQHDTSFANTFVGTPYYMSPEQMTHEHYNEKSDVWSLGCVLYEMAALHPPFMGSSHLELAKNITAGEFTRIPTYYSDSLQRLIRGMLSVTSEKRPSIEDLQKFLKKRVEAGSSRKSEEGSKSQIEDLEARERNILERETRLRQKEEELKAREKAMEEMERQFRAKLRALDEKENHTEAKLARAEKMIAAYKKRAKAETENRPPKSDSSKKDVAYCPTRNVRTASDGDTGSALKKAMFRGLSRAVRPGSNKYSDLQTKLTSLSSDKNQAWSALELIRVTCQQLEQDSASATKGKKSHPGLKERLEKLKAKSSELKRRHLECHYHNKQIIAFQC